MSLTDSFQKMERREQRLLLGLGTAVAAMVFLLLPYYLHRGVSDARDENQAVRDYVAKVNESRSKIEKRRVDTLATQARYEKTMPALGSFVADAAEAFEVGIAESNTKPDVPHGKNYVEHVLSVRLKPSGLVGIARMLEKIERSGFPVSISKLNLKPRAGEPDSYDVELWVSAFEKKGVKKTAAAETPKEEEEP